MKLVVFVLLYLLVGLVLEMSLSKSPNLWPVLIWPFMLIGVLIVWILFAIKPEFEKRVRDWSEEDRK